MKLYNKIIYLVLLSGFATAAGAVGGIADVTVYDRVENRTLPVYRHEGRYYVVGKPGNEYQVRVRNRTGQEILSVISVDGVNAVTGETANWDQTGYVFSGHQSFDIRGWRKSMDRIAAFYFTEHQNSYAARTGRPDNVGVIGVALFRKYYEPPVRIDPPVRPWPRPQPRQDSPYPSSSSEDLSGSAPGSARSEDSASAPATRGAPMEEQAAAPMARDRASAGSSIGPRGFDSGGIAQAPRKSTTLGTGHGRSEVSHVTNTEFTRATANPAEVITIHYNTHENLVRLGVIRPPVYAQPAPSPTPFPGQFVPDPR